MTLQQTIVSHGLNHVVLQKSAGKSHCVSCGSMSMAHDDIPIIDIPRGFVSLLRKITAKAPRSTCVTWKKRSERVFFPSTSFLNWVPPCLRLSGYLMRKNTFSTFSGRIHSIPLPHWHEVVKTTFFLQTGSAQKTWIPVPSVRPLKKVRHFSKNPTRRHNLDYIIAL